MKLPTPPTITSFSPTSGGTGTSVTITGTNFTGTTDVKFGGTAAYDFTVYSFTQITAVVDNGTTTGTVTVITPDGTATSSSSFTYGAVSAGTYYVNIASGNDSSNGTSDNPWKTLHYVKDQINGGTAGSYTLHVALGTYKVGNGLEADSGLIFTQDNVTVIGASGSEPIIDGTGASYWDYGIKIDASNVTLRNLYVTGFTGTNPSGTGIEIVSGSNNTIENCRVYENHDGISVWQSANCTIQGCQIDNNDFDGISISESAGSVITENTINDNFDAQADHSDGIIVEGCSPEISRNTIYDNRFNISLQGSETAETSPLIKNNLIYEATLNEVHYGIIVGGIDGSTVSPQIYHNTIDGSLYQGIHIAGTGDTPTIKFNIITNCRQSGIQNSGSPTIDYNDVWHNGRDPYERNYDGCTAGAHDISQDPKYGSYTLQSGSPCINAIPIEDPTIDPVTVDLIGDTRPYGAGFDMGCYEMSKPAVTTTAASSITGTTASSGGNVTSGGISSVTARGVCWSTSANPTITNDSYTTDGDGTGSYTSGIMGLNASTTYHVRAYATNDSGTSYGSDKTFTTPGPLSAGTYYVDTAGNNSNAGTAAAPWKTLHYAIDRINGGATGTSALPYALIMGTGTYNITDNGEADTAITLSQSYVTIIGAGDAAIGGDPTAVINGDGADDWTKAFKITGSYCTIKGLSITNFSSIGIEISGGTENKLRDCKIFANTDGVQIINSSTFKVQDCEIYSNTDDGLWVETSTGGGEIHRNTIYRHQGSGANGVYVNDCSPSIKRNKIYDNNTGIWVLASGGTASPDIFNNVIYETTVYTMSYGIRVDCNSGTASPTIYHNSLDGGTGDGIALEYGSGTLAPDIRYNIITNFDRQALPVSVGISANSTASGVTCEPKYNDVWGNGAPYENCTATNDISANPLNGQAGPLPSNSPCVDTIPIQDPTIDPAVMDYLGYKRPKGSGYDMGAYEYIAQQTYTDTLPGGTDAVTDYDIFTIPLTIGNATGKDIRDTMEGTLGDL